MFRQLFLLPLMSAVLTVAVLATPIANIKVQGNKRIEYETILSCLPFKIGDEYSTETMNNALKDLYDTGYFVDVQVFHEGNTVLFKVTENALINRIAFEGNSKLTDDKLREEVLLRPREVLSHAKVRAAQQRILDIYRRMGRFSAKVEPKIIPLEENRVDLVFEINEGETTYIRGINFIGNKHITSSKLKSAILSHETKWYRFFAADDVYDAERVEADKQALRQYYFNQGFPDFRLISAVAELSPDGSSFYLTFTIEEGAPYTFGGVDIASQINKIQPEDYKNSIAFSEGDTFSAQKVEKSMIQLTEAIGAHGYAFAVAEPSMTQNYENHTVDIKFTIKQGPLVYVERIEIIGNEHTLDKVIRREMQLHEGDAYNIALLRKSEKRIRDLGFFKNVVIAARPSSTPDKAIIIVKVEEQALGELSLSGGYATIDGIVGKVGYLDRNFMGKGQTVGVNFFLGRKFKDFNINFLEPYFLDKPVAAGGQLFVSKEDRFATYSHLSKGIKVLFDYELTETLSHSVNYAFHGDTVDHLRNASIFIQDQSGRTTTSSLGHTLIYDRRDSKIDPTNGYAISLSNVYAGIGGNVSYFKSIASANCYYTPAKLEEITFIVKARYGRVDRVNGSQIRVVDSFQLGADSLRGFEYGGVGPRAIDRQLINPRVISGDALGGTRSFNASLDMLFPIGAPKELGLKGIAFVDSGIVWRYGGRNALVNGLKNVFGKPLPGNTLYDFFIDNQVLRVSCGFGFSWQSPFGPINIYYSIPIRKGRGDITQRILFGFTTNL